MTKENSATRTAVARSEDSLPDGQEHAHIGGMEMRKGTVAAFLRNALKWGEPDISDMDRDALIRAMTEAVPALRALGVFSVFEFRDERLRALLTAE